MRKSKRELLNALSNEAWAAFQAHLAAYDLPPVPDPATEKEPEKP